MSHSRGRRDDAAGGRGRSTGRPPEEIKAVPVRHPGRWLAAVVVLVLVAMLVHTLVTNPRFEWDVVWSYFLSTPGAGRPGDHHPAHRRRHGDRDRARRGPGRHAAVANPLLSGSSWVYIWFFRGTPVLVQLLFWYNLAFLYPQISLGVPFGPVVPDR